MPRKLPPIDALSTAIAARMTGQLEQAASRLGVTANLPAAYAGDQRSLKSVLNQIHARENEKLGLPANPSRRKFNQQVGASAVRAALPDLPLGGLVSLTKQLAPSNVPSLSTEQIQTLLAKDLNNVLGQQWMDAFKDTSDWAAHLDAKGSLWHGVHPRDDLNLDDYMTNLRGVFDSDDLPDDFSVFERGIKSILPEAISERTGIPLRTLQEMVHPGPLSDHNLFPTSPYSNILDDIVEAPRSMDSFFDESHKSRFRDYGFRDLPEPTEELISTLRASEDPARDLADIAHRAELDRIYGNLGSYVGEDNLKAIMQIQNKNHVFTPRVQEDMFRSMLDNQHFWDNIDDWLYKNGIGPLDE